MTDIQAWIERGKTLADRATQGTWEARSSEVTMNDRSEWKIGKYSRPQVFRSVMRGDDAAFIADTRVRLPQALAVIQAVLEIHQNHGGTSGEGHCQTVRAIQSVLGEES